VPPANSTPSFTVVSEPPSTNSLPLVSAGINGEQGLDRPGAQRRATDRAGAQGFFWKSDAPFTFWEIGVFAAADERATEKTEIKGSPSGWNFAFLTKNRGKSETKHAGKQKTGETKAETSDVQVLSTASFSILATKMKSFSLCYKLQNAYFVLEHPL
jgi:hypothetical protein